MTRTRVLGRILKHRQYRTDQDLGGGRYVLALVIGEFGDHHYGACLGVLVLVVG